MTLSTVSQNKKREQFLDFAKGVCMITITYSHINGIPLIGKYLFSCQVLVYFFVSGYLAPTDGNARWLKRRLKRLFIPYVGYGTLLIIIGIIKWNIDGTFRLELLWRAIWGSVYSRAGIFYPYHGSDGQIYTFVCYNAGLWFFSALAWSTLWFALIINKCGDSIRKIMFSIMVLFTLSCLCMYLPVLLPKSIDTSFCGTILMLLGHLGRKDTLFIAFLIAVYFFLTGSNGNPNLSIREYGPAGATSLLSFIVSGTCGAVLYCRLGEICEKTWLGKCLACVGRHTVPIIMLQILLLAIINPIFEKFSFLCSNSFLYSTVGVIIVTSFGIAWDILLSRGRRLLTCWLSK